MTYAPLYGASTDSAGLSSTSIRANLDEEGREYLQIVCTECNRMGELISNMLDLSRLSRKEIVWEEVDLSGLVETIAAELHSSEPERQVDFIIAPAIKVSRR